ncbi:MAG: tetratricopeptide repeat protein, partial [Fimbriimonadales bacterium]|nr:tetratricopeptide repeat protein [Fimbriimonadales bacterium]
GLGLVALKRKDYAVAEAWLLEAARYEPHLVEIWQAFTMLYAEQQSWQRLRWALENWRLVDPQSPHALRALIAVYQRLNEPAKARELEKTLRSIEPHALSTSGRPSASSLSPRSQIALLESRAARAVQQRRYHDAIAHLEALHRLQPREPRHLFNRAICHLHLKQYEKAVQQLRRARTLGMPRAQTARLLAHALLEANRPADALPELEYLCRNNPKSVEYARAYGVLLIQQNRPQQAIEPLQQWAIRQPREPTAHYLLGVAHALTGRPQDALKPLAKAVQLAPRSLLMRYHYALVLAQAEKPQDAREQLEQVLNTQGASDLPLYPEIARALLSLLRQQKAWDAAESWLRQFERVKPDEPAWKQERALNLLQQERYADLRAYLEQTVSRVQHTPTRLALWGLWAESYLREGKSEEAVAVARRALPEGEPLLNLARHIARQGQHPRAIELLRELETARLTPAQQREVIIRLATLLQKSGQSAEAISRLRRAVQSRPNDLELRLALALALTNANAPDAAHAWHAVLKLQPQHAEARINLALLQAHQNHPQASDALWNALPSLLKAIHAKQVELVQQLRRAGGAIDLFWLMEAGEPANRLNQRLEQALSTLWQRSPTPAQQRQTLQRLQTLLQRHPYSNSLMEFLLQKHLQANRPADALGIIEIVLREYPTNAALYYRKGQILQQIGKSKQAREAYLQCLRLDPRHSEARRALEALANPTR